MNKIALSIISIALVIGLGIIFLGNSGDSTQTAGTQPGGNIEIKDGIQYITIEAKGGYSPRITAAKANLPTKLIVKTNSTYDCSAALVIRSLEYQKVLAQTGEEIIDIGTAEAGTSLKGTCSMGMYNFVINFS